jgi:NADPH:quinone reductase-like Zn-dependent oxidoreductase
VTIPAHVDFISAAALPLVFITLAESLWDRANVKAGESVLIHAGAGGTVTSACNWPSCAAQRSRPP